MKKRIGVISLILAVVMVCFAACSIVPKSGDSNKFSDRKYVRVEQSSISSALNQAVELSKKSSNGKQVVDKLQFATILFYDNYTNYTLAQIHSDLDTTSTYWVAEMQYCYTLWQKSYKLIREAEKQIFVSAVAPYCINIFGQPYVDSILNEQLNTPEQEQLLLEENNLSSQYSSLYNAKQYEEIEQLYIKLVKVRKKLATAFGYERYSDYAYQNVFSRDYTPDQAADFIYEVKDKIVPLYAQADSLEYQNMYTKLSEKQLLSSIEKTIKELGQNQLTEVFNYLKSNELYDFKVSDKKANTSYVTDLKAYNDAFMFINADGNYVDLNTVIHEFGHFSAVMLEDSEKASDNGLNYDIAETHSQGMEILALPALKNVLPKSVYNDYVSYQVSNIVSAITVQALFEEFEQYVFNLTEQQLDDPAIIDDIKANYNSIMSLIVQEGQSILSFVQVPHFFASPFYCISYSVSMLTALQFGYAQFANSTPIQSYTKLLTYGISQPFVKTLTKVGLKSPFEQSNITDATNYIKGLLSSVSATSTMSTSTAKASSTSIFNFLPSAPSFTALPTLSYNQVLNAA